MIRTPLDTAVGASPKIALSAGHAYGTNELSELQQQRGDEPK